MLFAISIASSKFLALMTASTGPKISSCEMRRVRVDVGDDGRLEEIALVADAVAAGEQAAFVLADIDVLEIDFSAPSLTTGPM